MAVTFKQIGEALGTLVDPEIRIRIVDLGLVYGAGIAKSEEGSGDRISVRTTLTSPACPYGPMMLAQMHASLSKIPGVCEVKVELVFSPPWEPKTMASDEAKDLLGIF